MDILKTLARGRRAVTMILPLGFLAQTSAQAAGVETIPSQSGLRGVSFLDTFSTGNPVDAGGEQQGLDWGAGLDGSVFSTTGDSSWLRGVAEGVSESVTSLISDGEILNDGLSVGSVTLDRSLFSYGGSAERTRTLLTALESFTQDVAAIVPTPAAIPLVLLVIVGVIAVRRRHG